MPRLSSEKETCHGSGAVPATRQQVESAGHNEEMLHTERNEDNDGNGRALGWFGCPYTIQETLLWVRHYIRPQLGAGLHGSVAACRADVPDGDSIRLLFFGDLMPPPFGRVPSVDPSLREIFASADLTIGNLEAAVGRDSTRLNRMQIAPDTLARALDGLAIRPDRCLLSIANNHAGDLGGDGIRHTATMVERLGITPLGWKERDGSPLSKILVKGLSIGFFSWTQWLNRPEPPGAASLWCEHDVFAWLAGNERQRTDFLVAFPHWGFEFEHSPRTTERELAMRLASHGVQLIVGHHPHVIQQLEWLESTACLYSLGNLVAGRGLSVRWPFRLGALLAIDVVMQPGGRVQVVGYEIHPIASCCSRRGNRIVPLAALKPRMRAKFVRRFDRIYPSRTAKGCA